MKGLYEKILSISALNLTKNNAVVICGKNCNKMMIAMESRVALVSGDRGRRKTYCCLKRAPGTTQWTCRWLEEEEAACP